MHLISAMFLPSLQLRQPIPANGISHQRFVLIPVHLSFTLIELLAKSLYVAIFPADVEQLKDAPLLSRQAGQSFLNLGGLPLDYRKVCRERIPAGDCVNQMIFPAAATALYWCSIAGGGPDAVHLLIVAADFFRQAFQRPELIAMALQLVNADALVVNHVSPSSGGSFSARLSP